mgnify:FL=1
MLHILGKVVAIKPSPTKLKDKYLSKTQLKTYMGPKSSHKSSMIIQAFTDQQAIIELETSSGMLTVYHILSSLDQLEPLIYKVGWIPPNVYNQPLKFISLSRWSTDQLTEFFYGCLQSFDLVTLYHCSSSWQQ